MATTSTPTPRDKALNALNSLDKLLISQSARDLGNAKAETTYDDLTHTYLTTHEIMPGVTAFTDVAEIEALDTREQEQHKNDAFNSMRLRGTVDLAESLKDDQTYVDASSGNFDSKLGDAVIDVRRSREANDELSKLVKSGSTDALDAKTTLAKVDDYVAYKEAAKGDTSNLSPQMKQEIVQKALFKEAYEHRKSNGDSNAQARLDASMAARRPDLVPEEQYVINGAKDLLAKEETKLTRTMGADYENQISGAVAYTIKALANNTSTTGAANDLYSRAQNGAGLGARSADEAL